MLLHLRLVSSSSYCSFILVLAELPGFARDSRSLIMHVPGLCSNALAFANASANAAFAFALAFDSFAADAFALAFAFDSSAFAFALAFDSNAFD